MFDQFLLHLTIKSVYQISKQGTTQLNQYSALNKYDSTNI